MCRHSQFAIPLILFRGTRILVIRSAEIHRLEVFAPVQVETLKQLADRVGISLGQARHLVHSGRLQHVMIGARRYVPEGAWERFITDNTVTPCPDATVAPNYAGSQSASASTSHGPSTAAAASAQLARQTANKLKSFSLNGCSGELTEKVQVTPLRSS